MKESPQASKAGTATKGLAAFLPNNFLSAMRQLVSGRGKAYKSPTHFFRRAVHGAERRKYALPCTETTGDVHRAVRKLRKTPGNAGMTAGFYISERLAGRPLEVPA